MGQVAIDTKGLVNPHCHFREDQHEEGDLVPQLVDLAVEGGAVVLGPMPNVSGGLKTAEEVAAYLRSAGTAEYAHLTTFIGIVLITDRTTRADIEKCVAAGIYDGKIYPLNRTTGSDKLGVRDYHRLIEIVRICGELGVRVHLHPEYPLMSIPSRDAEYMFISTMDMLMRSTEDVGTVFVWEHGTDSRCILFWREWAQTGRFYVTLTAHHLAADEDDTFGDVRAACKPPIKTNRDKYVLRLLVREDNHWVMAGLDDAPHPEEKKFVDQGRCACGAYTAPFGLQLYAHALLSDNSGLQDVAALRRLTSDNARALYGLPSGRMDAFRLVWQPFTIPLTYNVGPWTVRPFWAGETIDWSLEFGDPL
jgi:dihydroorotase (homodimeric type)